MMSSDERNVLEVLRERLEEVKSELAKPGAGNRRNSDRIQKLDEAMVAVEVLISRPKNRQRAS
jgi:hypothetical protein